MILGDMGAEVIKVEKPGMTASVTWLLIPRLRRHLQNVHRYYRVEESYPLLSYFGFKILSAIGSAHFANDDLL